MHDNVLNPQSVTLAVLAGGRGTRMGMPKSHLRVEGQPLLAWLLDRWCWPGPTMLITAPGNEHPPGSERFDVECVDPVADEGPLRGVLTALTHATTPRLIIATCDMPLIERWQFESLIESLNTSSHVTGVTFVRPADGRSHIEPFPAALSRALLPALRSAYGIGERSPTRFARSNGFKTVADSAPDDAWLNLNTPADYQRFSDSVKR